MNKIRLAIVGATGLVGRTVLKVLEEKNLPISEYVLFASSKSAGKKIHLIAVLILLFFLQEAQPQRNMLQ